MQQPVRSNQSGYIKREDVLLNAAGTTDNYLFELAIVSGSLVLLSAVVGGIPSCTFSDTSRLCTTVMFLV
jgi:hypothetical protein